MNENSKSILELTHDEAQQYFLKQESYCNFDLPEYFQFENILSTVNTLLNGKKLSDFRENNPRDYDDVNYKILNNKDGKYAWRPLQLINPMIYVSLVHRITEATYWQFIQDRFKKFKENEKIECISIPRQSLSKNSDKAEQITNWWNHIEKRSIELALDYSCLIHTDLTDCYGAIYTHSIAWALHGKNTAKANQKNKKFIGNQIDDHLQDMSHGQTNGIPQGSSLMDFIAEILLGYADLKLSECLEKAQVINYKILRYRDDYRIYSQSTNDNDKILKCLTEVMIELGLKLSASKTNTHINLIQGSIKSDKLYWIKQKQTVKNLQKHLLIIHDLSMQFPNSGSLNTALQDFYDRVNKFKKIDNIIPLVSILTDIAHNNPKTYPYFIGIISLLLKLDNRSVDDKKKLLEKIINKFSDIPNTGHLDIWVQRVTLGIKCDIPLKEPLCKLVIKEPINIWNFSWLKEKTQEKLNINSIINQDLIEKLSEEITRKEIELFSSDYELY